VLPEAGALIGVGMGAAFAASLLLLLATVRGFRPDDARPPAGWQIWWRAVWSPRARLRIGTAIGVGVLVLVLTRWPVAAIGTGALITAWPYLFGGARAEQHTIARLEALITWTESLRDTVAAHANLEQAIAASLRRAPPLIQPAMARLDGQIRVQTPLKAALLDLAEDLDAPGADLVIAALILSVSRRGDRLAQVLSALVSAAREDLDLRRKISAGRAGLRRSVQIIIVITVAIAAYLTLFAGAFMHPYDTAGGQLALALVISLFAGGFIWMRRLATDQDTMPFLTRPGRPNDPGQAQIIRALTGLSTPTASGGPPQYGPTAPGRGNQ